MYGLYTVFIYLYILLIKIAALFSPKARLWVNGRVGWRDKLKSIDFKGQNVYWVHCASLGEFEQGRPFIEDLKKQNKGKILLTFFSPSGYEVQNKYPYADWVYYLPSDTQANVNFWLETIKPKAVFFVKYEFWFNFLNTLRKQKIPCFLISGVFRKEHYFFKWYGKWASRQLICFNWFFLQNNDSFNLLQGIGYNNATVAGDTRFDRVYEILKNRKHFKEMDLFIGDNLVLVAGSTYSKDDKLLKQNLEYFLSQHKSFKLVIVPHEINSTRIRQCMEIFGKENCIVFSDFDVKYNMQNILIVDTVGMLSSLYAYAHTAYIGGGFDKGIHNTLEAAVYGIPIVFGPAFQKFNEAHELIQAKAAFAIHDEHEASVVLEKLLFKDSERKVAGGKAHEYVLQNKGAVKRIIEILKQKGWI